MAMHRYAIFETDGGFCGIAWNDVGITRFQLPTGNERSTERLFLRRLPQAERRTPPAHIAEAIAAVKRYFAGERVDFSPLVLDLGDQDEFFRQIYSAARRIGWGHTTTYGTLARERCNEARGTRRRACGSRSMPMRCPG